MTANFSNPSLPHHLDLIKRHRPLRVVRVLITVRRLAAVAIAAQVGDDDRVVLCQFGRNQPPGDVRLRGAVQQQDRRSLPAMTPLIVAPVTWILSRLKPGKKRGSPLVLAACIRDAASLAAPGRAVAATTAVI